MSSATDEAGVVAEYSDTATGAKFTRSGLDGLMTAARKRA